MRILAESVGGGDDFARSPAYGDYEAILRETDNQRSEIGRSTPPDRYPDGFFRNVELCIRYGPFTKLGKGSSRTAYSFDADPRYVLKFAHNVNGLRQNQTELKNVKKGDYRCLVRIHEYDPSGVLIVEDMCRQSEYSDWYRIIGISPNMLSKVIRVAMGRMGSDRSFTLSRLLDEIRDFKGASRILAKTSAMDDELTPADHPKVVACLDSLVKAANGRPVAEKWKVMYDLFRFYFDNGLSAMIPEEILYVDQWGVRPGETPDGDCLVIIDPGVDSDFMPFVGQNGRVA